ncbi:phosphonate ABC transporter inner membrane subunit [Halorubrum aidingense JCM 13560]|uniref:Phosphonate ABC transporter inner membrane subunit n=1 Tax=Halorubrum aidingense JCM 13560 TaxID=1230454 RepID=M0P9I2_9EURY|nr:phosphonate ABC transporter, permease protein PhnE [Halorubrum aidingense]EMA66696.1 phosphonate ABC transporter inner membrane subunit [Halorubrum aidingense JCM 13560]
MAGATREWSRFDARERLFRIGGALVAVAVVVASWEWLDMSLQYVTTAPAQVGDLLGRMYPPDWGYLPNAVGPLAETIQIAVVGTIAAVAMAAPVAYITAENTTPNRATYALGKLIVTVSRSVHTIVWALLFVVMFGPGALAGTVATAVRSIGFLAKLLGEEIEEINFGQVEGIRAVGASPAQLLIYGIVPQIKPALVGLTVYRWDINVRAATILGFVGAGGIGVQLFEAIDSFAWRTVSALLFAILAVVLVSEGISAYARRKVR